MRAPLAAVIFDFDGVVFDSETPEYESHRRLYEECGVALTIAEWCDSIGVWSADHDQRRFEQLCARAQRAPARDEYHARRHQLFTELAPRDPMRGVLTLLDRLDAAHVLTAIASTAPARWVRAAVDRLGLTPRFRAIVTGDDVARRKPEPDVYLEALRRIGIEPHRAVAIEDSAPGVTAARAAGLRVVAIPHWLTATHDLDAADLRVAHAGELTLDALSALIVQNSGLPMADERGSTAAPAPGVDFIRAIVDEDLAAGRHNGRVATRFPPEPNGYLHIGHAKSICLNFGVAEERGGICNLRFDDTNPTKEDIEYVDSIRDDVEWLGFHWAAELYASDYFERLYAFAVDLIKRNLAYVDSLSADDMRAYRGTLTEPGRNSPYRDRPAAESLDLLARMRAGEFPDGAHVLRAKIDMASPNINMRDPTLYRIRHAHHHRTGDAWCIYPMYDFAHPLSDAIEHITHSICTLEYEDHRPLYDWLVDNLIEGDKPRQYEFARLNLNYTVMSKRKLLQLVEQRHVSGWDDPRMPTVSGLRRRGYTPESIRDFCARIGVAKKENVIDVAQLEHSVREDLNKRAPRVMTVLRPLKVVLTNYPEGQGEHVDVINNPEDELAGTRRVPFSRELYIERDDFMENPPKKFFRLSPGSEVRLRCAYFIRCTEVMKDASGEIVELRCTYDPATRGGDAPDGRRVKATLHWVSAAHAVPVEVRLYDRLFNVENPENVHEGKTFLDNLNPASLEVLPDCHAEPSLADARVGTRVQFERIGYFCVDPDTTPGHVVFNRTVSLRDTWAKIKDKS